MRDVKAGRLKATGGGRGVRLAFVKADVETFKKRRSGVVNADVFARIAFASWVKRTLRADLETAGEQERQAIKKELHERDLWLYLKGLWWCWSAGKYDKVDIILKNCLPPRVPPEFIAWARQFEQIFEPREMDYLAAMFVVVEYPVAFPKKGERVLPKAFQLIKESSPQFFTTRETLQQSPKEWDAIKESIAQDLTQLRHKQEDIQTIAESGHVPAEKLSDLRALLSPIFNDNEQIQQIFYEPKNKDAAWSLYRQHHPVKTLRSTLLTDFHEGKAQDMRKLIEDSSLWERDCRPVKFPEVMPVMEGLGAEAKMFKRFRDRQGKGNPSGAKIALVLGIHRYQATRLWKSIARKLGSQQWKLFAIFGWKTKSDLPLLLKRYATEPVAKRSVKAKQRAKPIDREDYKAAVAECIKMFSLKPGDVPSSRAAFRKFLLEKMEARCLAGRMALAGNGKGQTPLSREDESEMQDSAGDSE